MGAAASSAAASAACAPTSSSTAAATGGLWREMRSWVRYLSPASRYLAVPYFTPPHVVAAMLRLAHVGPGDTLLDLGCGDGRILLAAVRVRNWGWTNAVGCGA
jgi:hypothetical protein